MCTRSFELSPSFAILCMILHLASGTLYNDALCMPMPGLCDASHASQCDGAIETGCVRSGTLHGAQPTGGAGLTYTRCAVRGGSVDALTG